MKTEAVCSLPWQARISRALIFALICFTFVGFGWYQPNAADAETLTVSNPYSIPTGTKYDTAAYVLMQRFDLTSGGAAVDGKAVLNSLTLDDGGGTATSFNAARVYISSTSSTTLPANAVQVGRTALGSTWSGGSTPITLSTAATVTTGSPMYLYILFDMAPGQAPLTARSNVTAIGTVADGAAAGAFPFLSAGTISLVAGGTKATVTSCVDCHGTSLLDSPTRSAATGSFQGSHNKHVDSKSYACSACHVNPVATNHRNNYINMTSPFQYGGAGNYSKGSVSFPQSSTPTPFGNCSTIYCHSNGAGTYSTATWGNTLAADCTGCHGGNITSAAPIATNAHTNHFTTANVGRVLNCRDCHNATVTSTTDRTISTQSNHVTGSLNIKFDNSLNLNSDNPVYSGLSTTATSTGAQVAGGANGACNNVYCHSSGNLSAAGGSLVAVGTVSWKQPDWNTPGVACYGCHGDGASKSHPIYATGSAGSTTANSHVKHVDSNSIGCAYCHTGTVGTNTTTTPTSMPSNTWHLNRTEDVTILSIGSKTGIYNPAVGTKSCSATYCHAGNAPQWGGAALDCASCHDASSALSTGATNSNRHSMHYETTAVATTIGISNGPTTTQYQFGCGNCHDRTQISHVTGTNDVKFNIVLSGTTTTTGSYAAGGSLLTDNRGVSYSQNGTCTNIYCHSNGQPINTAVSYRTVTWNQAVGISPNDCSVCHGGRSDSTQGQGPIATNRHTTHITSLQYNFSCAECHYGTTTTGTTIANKQNHVDGNKDVVWRTGGTNSGGTAYATPNCTNIYCHSRGTSNFAAYPAPRVTVTWNAVQVLDCAGCHGNTAATLTTGAHAAHLNTSTWLAGVISCEDCHNATATNNTTLNSYTNHVNKFVTINLSAQSSGATATYSGSVVGGASVTQKTPGSAMGTCNTTYCHGGNSQVWSATNPGVATCVKCHGVAGSLTASYATDTMLAAPGYISAASVTGVNTSGGTGAYTNGVSNDPKVGAHDSHLRGTSKFKPNGIGCDDCHAVTALTSSGHMNGSTTFVWSTLAKNQSTVPYFADKGTITPGYVEATGTCSTNYCHGGGFAAGVVGTGATVTWTNTGYLTSDASVTRTAADCNKCHMSPPTASGKFDHSAMTLLGDDCAACHNHNGSGNTHIDGILQGSGSCNACHDYDVDATTGDWGKQPKAVEGFGAHAVHITHLKTLSGVTLSALTNTFGGAQYVQVCGVCHGTQTTLHSMGNGSNFRTINFNNSGVYSFQSGSVPLYNGTTGTSSQFQAKTCSNLSCHYQTTPVWQGY